MDFRNTIISVYENLAALIAINNKFSTSDLQALRNLDMPAVTSVAANIDSLVALNSKASQLLEASASLNIVVRAPSFIANVTTVAGMQSNIELLAPLNVRLTTLAANMSILSRIPVGDVRSLAANIPLMQTVKGNLGMLLSVSESTADLQHFKSLHTEATTLVNTSTINARSVAQTKLDINRNINTINEHLTQVQSLSVVNNGTSTMAYDPVNNEVTFNVKDGLSGLPGVQGDRGNSVEWDAKGIIHERMHYNIKDPGFLYLSTDESLPTLYARGTDRNDWIFVKTYS